MWMQEELEISGLNVRNEKKIRSTIYDVFSFLSSR